MTERIIWNNRYSEGGNSGKGSVGKYRKWKWQKIIKTVGEISNKSIVDVGCGDMSFWKMGIFGTRLRECKHYVGIDFSEDIISKNILKYPDKRFLCLNAKYIVPDITADVVLCMDLLFHIMRKKHFIKILNNLCMYSKEWIIIYTWMYNPLGEEITDYKYQYFRPLLRYTSIFTDNGFRQPIIYKIPYDVYGGMFIYRRKKGEKPIY